MRFRRAQLRAQAVLAPALLSLVWLSSAACQNTPEPDFEDIPPANELYEQGLEKLNDKWLLWIIPRTDYVGAIEDFQAIIDNYPYSDFAVKAELRIADSYFEDRRFEEALSYYRDFSDLHPQHEKVPYTILRSAQCHYEQTATIDRDQTATREAMGYLERLLRDYPYAPETRDGEQTLLELRGRLARGVLARGDFYLDRDEYQAAAERYRSLLNEYPGLGHDAEALYKLGVCYDHMKLRDEALRLYHVIVENYRESDLAEEAQERISSAN
ncbi:MAG: outer membrane protein assembly factor BamD [Myxococcota bacterium]|nr:outer membrane protein assembly factor BamD [Myxococcota bacterium]